MLKFLIILAAWITPGITLFLYLLWISKRRKEQRAQLELPLTEPAVSIPANNDGQRLEKSSSAVAAREPRESRALEKFG